MLSASGVYTHGVRGDYIHEVSGGTICMECQGGYMHGVSGGTIHVEGGGTI